MLLDITVYDARVVLQKNDFGPRSASLATVFRGGVWKRGLRYEAGIRFFVIVKALTSRKLA